MRKNGYYDAIIETSIAKHLISKVAFRVLQMQYKFVEPMVAAMIILWRDYLENLKYLNL